MFFIIPVGVDYRARRIPAVTFALMGVNALVYVIALLVFLRGGVIAEAKLVMALGLIPQNVRVHTLLTSIFTHTDFFHLLGNLIYLYLFGACVEDILGRWRFLLFYLTGGLAADFVHILVSVLSGAGDLPMIGASGAISACLGGFVLLLGRAQINFRWFFWVVIRAWSGDFWLPAWQVISFWFLKDLFSTVLSVASQSGDGGIAFGAHVGGFLGGFGLIAIRRLKDRKEMGTVVLHGQSTIQRHPGRRSASAPAGEVYLYDAGVQIGPVTIAQAQAMLDNGSISTQAYYWRPGMSNWDNICELFRE